MKLLLDSNAFIWTITQPSELAAPARRAIEASQNDRLVGISSLWEIAIKASSGKLVLPANYLDGVDHIGAQLLPVSMAHVNRTTRLPFHHRDPFDRMLIAQAMEEGLTIVTRDRSFAAYGVPLLTA